MLIQSESSLDEPRVALNWRSGDTLGVRRHDRDVVPPASTSGVPGLSLLRGQVQTSSRAVAPASLEAREASAP